MSYIFSLIALFSGYYSGIIVSEDSLVSGIIVSESPMNAEIREKFAR